METFHGPGLCPAEAVFAKRFYFPGLAPIPTRQEKRARATGTDSVMSFQTLAIDDCL